MIDIEYRVGMAKMCFDCWEREHYTTEIKHYMYVEDFFCLHMYNEVVDLGGLMKQLHELAEHELERVYEAKQQRAVLAKCKH